MFYFIELMKDNRRINIIITFFNKFIIDMIIIVNLIRL